MNYYRLLSVLASTVNRVRRVETLAGVNELLKGEQAGFDSPSICLHHIKTYLKPEESYSGMHSQGISWYLGDTT